MKQLRIRPEVITKILENTRMMNLLALQMDCSVWTVQRYLKGNSDNLTKASVIELIKKELVLKQNEVLEEMPNESRTQVA